VSGGPSFANALLPLMKNQFFRNYLSTNEIVQEISLSKGKISLKQNIPTRKIGNTTLKLEDAYVGQ
jgi:hypothetical protein